MKGICKNCDDEFNYFPSQKNGFYCTNKCQGEFNIKKRFTSDSTWKYSMGLYLKKIRGNKCEECNIEDWNGIPLTFQVDHIDGNRRNNVYENLKIICPNCHSQTKTWGILNMSEEGYKKLCKNSL